MDQVLVALIVLAAAFFIGRRIWRAAAASRAPKDGCGGDCCGH